MWPKVCGQLHVSELNVCCFQSLWFQSDVGAFRQQSVTLVMVIRSDSQATSQFIPKVVRSGTSPFSAHQTGKLELLYCTEEHRCLTDRSVCSTNVSFYQI